MEEKKEKGNFWLTVATFIVNKRKAFLVLFAIACIYCAACMNKVSVNQDITKYLPADSETRIGLTLMDEQFMTYGSARIMVSNITWQDADALVEKLEAVEGVKEVAFDDSADHYNGTNALFDVTFDGTEEDEISKDAKQAVKELLSDYDTYISTSVGAEEEQTESLNNDMNLILVLAVVIIVVVLLISTKAYMEIPVLLITFGVAALLNKGTNYLMGTISSVTDSISVVLQLALAIDYAIIFCDRFMEEHETMDAESAIKVALSKAIPEISSSSLTTISGMVAMMFMHFRLGYDMGIVLVKAIIFSLISVFFLMPLVPPLLGRKLIMVAGGAGCVVVEGRHVVFPEGRIERRAVTGFATLHVLAPDRTFVVAFLTGDLLLEGVLRVLEDHRAAGVVQQDALGHGFVRQGQHISHHGQDRQTDCQQSYRNVTLLQRCTPYSNKTATIPRRRQGNSARAGLLCLTS